jgi:hypothetical protein
MDIREYCEDVQSAEIVRHENGRMVIKAYNEGGHNCTCVDLIDVLAWVFINDLDIAKLKLNSIYGKGEDKC